MARGGGVLTSTGDPTLNETTAPTTVFIDNFGTIESTGNLTGNAALRSFTQSSTGSLLTSMTSSGAKTLTVSGQATLAGALTITAAPGTYKSGAYNVLKAGGITGAFTSLSGNLSSFARRLIPLTQVALHVVS